jgi:hypothetical protein
MVPLERAYGRARLIAVNNSWKLCPWADVLYAVDARWWLDKSGCPKFRGMKVTGDKHAAQRYGLKLVMLARDTQRIQPAGNELVTWGGNSGFQAMNLAIKWGCAKVVLVGIDVTVKNGVHWHGKHGKGLGNPTETSTKKWAASFDGAATELPSGVSVVNCSPLSALKCFPKMAFEEALEAVA